MPTAVDTTAAMLARSDTIRDGHEEESERNAINHVLQASLATHGGAGGGNAGGGEQRTGVGVGRTLRSGASLCTRPRDPKRPNG